MKKTITLLLIATSLMFVATAQKKGNIEATDAPIAKLIKAPTDTLKISASVKVVTIDSVNISLENLKLYAAEAKAGKVPLYVLPDWIVLNYQFIKKASSPGFNDDQMDLLKDPLLPWVRYIQSLQKQKQ